MYGLVNKAIRDMVIRDHGDALWQRIRADAGVEDDIFISNDPYPDELTTRLVGAASKALATPAEEVLQAFGRHWILHTAQESYAGYLDSGGRTLSEFLVNLPSFHVRIHLLMPDLIPPTFSCEEVTAQGMSLHYRSRRDGLAPFVVGLLQGLATRFDTSLQIVHAKRKSAGADHDVFSLRWD